MRILVNDNMRAALSSEIERSGITPNRIGSACKLPPLAADPKRIYRWLSGETKSANATEFEACLAFWKSLPDAPEDVRITSELVNRLNTEKIRSGIGAKALLTSHDNIPPGITASFIANLLNGRYRTITRARYDWLVGAWACLPDAPKRIELTDDMIGELAEAIDRTKAGPFKLLRGTSDERPDGITGSMIQSWLNGTARTARADHWEYVKLRLDDIESQT